MPYHLPILLNPLINAVLNCPTPSTSPLRKLFTSLQDKNFILLVPSTEVLLTYKDMDQQKLFTDLCYNHDFVASHILLEREYTNSTTTQEFKSLNGSNITVRTQHNLLISNVDQKKCKIIGGELICNFNEYFKGIGYFSVLYIDRPLSGNIACIFQAQIYRKSDHISNSLLLSGDKIESNSLSLEEILKRYPDVMERLNSMIYTARIELRNSVSTIDSITDILEKLRDTVYQILGTNKQLVYVQHLYITIGEYLESRLYQDVWDQLVVINKGKDIEDLCDYNVLQYISLNQIGTSFYPRDKSKFDLGLITKIEKRIDQATSCFKKIVRTQTQREKTEILVSSLQYLTQNLTQTDKTVIIDTDTLISLFVIVTCRSQVPNLTSHLAYIENFTWDKNNVKFGVIGYAVSTLEAVLCYLAGCEGTPGMLNVCEQFSRENKILLDNIINGNIDKISNFKHLMQIRTLKGESLLSLSIQNKHFDIFEFLLLEYHKEFPLEDILFDENLYGSSLLIQGMETSDTRFVDVLVNILVFSCTETEISIYLNKPDIFGRTAGHYIPLAPDLIIELGCFINWTYRDLNGYTPLFTVCRSYDHPSYTAMVHDSFAMAFKWYKKRNIVFRMADHDDKKGNTLLHIMKSHIDILLSLETTRLNQPNKKGMVPLMVYAKYNRIDNILQTLKDNRIIIGKEQKISFSNFFDFTKNPIILKQIGNIMVSHYSFFKKIKIYNLKFEDNTWYLWMTIKKDDKFFTLKHSLKNMRRILLSFTNKYPMSFLPINKMLSILEDIGQSGLMYILKLESNFFILKMSLLFEVIAEDEEFKYLLGLTEKEIYKFTKLGLPKFVDTNFNKFEPEEINSIQKFLRFNLQEFQLIKEQFKIFKKLSIFQYLKFQDFQTSVNLLIHQTGQICCSDVSTHFKTFSFETRSYSRKILSNRIDFFEECLNTLIEKIENTLKDKITYWWKLYGENLAFRKEYSSKFPANPNIIAQGGFFETYIQTKRRRQEERLSLRIKNSFEKLKNVTYDIREAHEKLAEEFSNFMKFKDIFYSRCFIKEYALNVIRDSKDEFQQIDDILHKFKKN